MAGLLLGPVAEAVLRGARSAHRRAPDQVGARSVTGMHGSAGMGGIARVCLLIPLTSPRFPLDELYEGYSAPLKAEGIGLEFAYVLDGPRPISWSNSAGYRSGKASPGCSAGRARVAGPRTGLARRDRGPPQRVDAPNLPVAPGRPSGGVARPGRRRAAFGVRLASRIALRVGARRFRALPPLRGGLGDSLAVGRSVRSCLTGGHEAGSLSP